MKNKDLEIKKLFTEAFRKDKFRRKTMVDDGLVFCCKDFQLLKRDDRIYSYSIADEMNLNEILYTYPTKIKEKKFLWFKWEEEYQEIEFTQISDKLFEEICIELLYILDEDKENSEGLKSIYHRIRKKIREESMCTDIICSKEFAREYNVNYGSLASGVQWYIEYLEEQNKQIKNK